MAKISAPVAPKKALTVQAIDEAIAKDNGNMFRERLLYHLPRIADAYRQDDETDDQRTHLGASQIGRECDRELYYGWRWALKRVFPPRILRLFNRGHQEEARFLAMLDMIGVQFHQPEDGSQERISDYNGHFGSALDGVLWGVPDCPNEWILGEFKTHNTKSFVKLVSEGVRKTKPEHYAQMQTCMARRGIYKCLYMAVNKNDDDVYAEIVAFDDVTANSYLTRAGRIIFATEAPPKVSNDPSNFKCAFCDARPVCHYGEPVQRNCRTCVSSEPKADGSWVCRLHQCSISKVEMLAGCDKYELIPTLRG